MRLLIVIVNYRTAGLVVDCLQSLRSQVPGIAGGARVVVTDNLSPDDSVVQLRKAIDDNGFGQWVELRPLPRNGGFAYGNNEGFMPALHGQDKPQYVLLLNPDTVVRDGALMALLEFMDARPDVGIAGSRLEDPDGTPQRSAFRFHSVWSELEGGARLGAVSKLLRRHVVAPPVPTDATATDWVAGASMIIRREVIEQIGPMDDGFFMYFEEVDFCLRARRAGWSCWYVPASRVVHLVGQASGITDKGKKRSRRPAYWFAARRRYFVKNHGRLKTALADLLWSAAFGLFRVRQIVQRKVTNDPPKLWWDFVRYNLLGVRTK